MTPATPAPTATAVASGRLTGQVAVVTGAGQGIGRAVARRFAREGGVVVAADRDAAAVRATAAAEPERLHPARADVTDPVALAELADRAEELGPLSIWVNNAGITHPAMLHKMDIEDFDRVWQVNGRAVFLGIRLAAQRMIDAGTPGAIINVTSSAGLAGTIGQINYAAAKGAVTAMTKSAARELGRRGIRVNAVAPIAATPMTEKLRTDERLSTRYLANIPLGRFGEPDEIAEAFLYLADPASGAFVTGQVLCADGGLYMAS